MSTEPRIRQIRHKDLLSRYDFVVVKTKEGERECHPRDVKPGEIVELPVSDSEDLSDYAHFEVLPDLSTAAKVVDSLLNETRSGYLNSPDGALAMLRSMVSQEQEHEPPELDLSKQNIERIDRDPSVDGVFRVVLKNGVRIICYLAGYEDPWGNKRKHDDFEVGMVPKPKRSAD